jgi:hypothetical protein
MGGAVRAVRRFLCVWTVLLAASVCVSGEGQAEETVLSAGEAYTSYSDHDLAEVGPRLFHAPGFVNYCKGFRADAVRRLRVSAATALRLRVGETLYLHKPPVLKIVALDAKGGVLERIPVGIEARAAHGVLNENARGEGAVTPIGVGTVRFLVSTLCQGPRAEATLTVRVLPASGGARR